MLSQPYTYSEVTYKILKTQMATLCKSEFLYMLS
nr:MAG TPA: hypothetical protein [Caudoviricetes sp.]